MGGRPSGQDSRALTAVRDRVRDGRLFCQAEDGIRDLTVTGVQTCALPLFATPLGLDLSQVASLCGLVYSPVSDRSGLEPAIADAIAAPPPTMVAVRFKREDSVNGHRLCWEAAASALKG